MGTCQRRGFTIWITPKKCEANVRRRRSICPIYNEAKTATASNSFLPSFLIVHARTLYPVAISHFTALTVDTKLLVFPLSACDCVCVCVCVCVCIYIYEGAHKSDIWVLSAACLPAVIWPDFHSKTKSMWAWGGGGVLSRLAMVA